MAKQRAPKAPKKPKGITPEFESVLNSADAPSLKQLIVTMQQQLEEVHGFLKGEEDSEASRELLRLKQELSELEAPARETRAVLTNRTKAVLKVLAERGQL